MCFALTWLLVTNLGVGGGGGGRETYMYELDILLCHVAWALATTATPLNSGRKIAPNTGANATKFFTLATKSWELVAKLATRISNHTLPRDSVIVEDLYKSAAKFLVKPVTKSQQMHDFET